MPKTISFHNGTTWSRGHNIRDERYTSKQEHIDSSLTEQNVIVRDIPVRQAYAEIFDKSVEEYNAKQKRSDRKIDCYYDKIKADKRKHLVYECIVQIGDRDDTGHTAEPEKQALKKFAEEWDKRNPNLRLIGAYIHCDEPDGTVHMHMDYIPVAECTRGMRLQNSLDRALCQQGFHSENIHQTAQIAWQDKEREALCAICRELNIDAQRNQGISEGRNYLTPREYRKAKEQQKAQIDEELEPLKAELEEYRELDISAKSFPVDKKKSLLGKKVSVSAEDMEKLEEQAKAYRVNCAEIGTLRKRKMDLDEKEKELTERENQLGELAEQLKNGQEVLRQEQLTVKALYERQKGLNQLLEQSESKISSLTHENGSLTACIAERDITIHDLQERLKKALQTQREAYESLADIVKAVGMLKYDKEDGYGAELTKKQDRLIDAIARYGSRMAEADGHHDLAEDMERHIGISKELQNDIRKLTHEHSHGMSL